MEWGREEERAGGKVVEVERVVGLKDGRRGRIVCFKADVGGRLGAKVCTFFVCFPYHFVECIDGWDRTGS